MIPLVALVAFALVPTVLLGSAWQYADANVPPTTTTTTTTLPPEPTPELETPLFSFRRYPDPVAAAAAAEAADAEYRELVDEFTALVPTGSCARIVADGRVLAEVEPDLPVIPASNQKLLVAATALDVLGPDHRFRTELRSVVPDAGVIHGNLFLVGGGDPVLVTADVADPRPFPAFNTTPLEALADQVVALGVTVVEGDVVGDGSRYDDEFRAPTWGDEILYGEGGPYDALMVNDGLVDPINYGRDPSRAAAVEFRDLLVARGVVVTGAAANYATPADPAIVPLASIESLPLTDVLVELLHTSDNNTAEMIVKEIGVAGAGEGTRAAGLRVVRETLASWDISLEGVQIEDGSGLSREDRSTCRLLTSLLGSPVADELVALLPVAGRDGTLATSFIGTAAEGTMRAKTGTLTGVKALSGTMPDGLGDDVDFSLVLNGDGVDDPAAFVPVWAGLVDLIDAYPVEAHIDLTPFEPVWDGDGAPATTAPATTAPATTAPATTAPATTAPATTAPATTAPATTAPATSAPGTVAAPAGTTPPAAATTPAPATPVTTAPPAGG